MEPQTSHKQLCCIFELLPSCVIRYKLDESCTYFSHNIFESKFLKYFSKTLLITREDE